MLVVVFQFCYRDWLRAAKLAHLLADLESHRRDDVCLLFVRAPDFAECPEMDAVFARCAEVFRVEHLLVRPDSPSREYQWSNLGSWIAGSNILFSAAAEHVVRRMDPRWRTIFFADAGDGVPLHREWATMFVEDHARTEEDGLSVTGALRDARGVLHINGNQLVSRPFLEAHPEFFEVPAACQEWDVHRAPVILPVARVSSLIYGGWCQYGVTSGQVGEIARHSAWWHGCKDVNFVDLARSHIFGQPRPRPELVDLGRASLLQKSRFSSS